MSLLLYGVIFLFWTKADCLYHQIYVPESNLLFPCPILGLNIYSRILSASAAHSYCIMILFVYLYGNVDATCANADVT